MTTASTNESQPLVTLDLPTIKTELTEQEADVKIESAEEQQVNDAVLQILAIDPTQELEKQGGIAAVENMGSELQKMAARRSDMLKQSIGALAKSGEDGGPVARSLVELQTKVEELDPNNFEFTMNFLRKLLSKLPFVGTPLSEYFARYQSADSVISNIIKSLELGRDQLKRDNITLADDQKHFHQLAEQLKKAIAFSQMVDKKLTEKLDNELLPEDPRTSFIKEEIIFPLRQRTMDLQQQLAVAQQGALTIEVIKRNNKELIRGVNRALNVTVNALQVAVTLALALANQKIVLEKVEAINATTNDLIAKTAANLKQQGAAIHKQAASAQLSLDVLKQAFADINSALEDISRFRQDALPGMATTIVEMDKLSKSADESIKKFDQSQKIEKKDVFDFIDAEAKSES